MKSIIQEASSIAKAVEEGWIKAQKPQQFSVKILEESEKNFIGFTTKSAKVAIFFDEPQVSKSEYRNNPQTHRQQTTVQQRPQPTYTKTTEDRQPSFQGREKQVQQPKQPQQIQKNAPPQQPIQPQAQSKKQFEPLWNQGMVDRTHQWMSEAFKNSHNEHIQFTVEPQKFHLRITLSAPILNDPDKEKQLLASFSALILETLKRSFKMSLRGHKIVLTHKK